MNEGVQSFLYVYTRTECIGASENNTDFSGIDLIEYFNFLLDGHAGFHHNNLFGRDTLFNKFPADVLIEVKAALFILIVVSKNSDSTFVSACFFKTAECLPYCFICLALRFVCGI